MGSTKHQEKSLRLWRGITKRKTLKSGKEILIRNIFSGEQTLQEIAERLDTTEPLFFTRFTDGDIKIINQSYGLRLLCKKRRSADIAAGKEPRKLYERECPKLRLDLMEANNILHPNFEIHSYRGNLPLYPCVPNCNCVRHESRLTHWNTYSFAIGPIHPDFFIPWIKKSLHGRRVSFIGRDFSDNEFFKKIFNVQEVLPLPSHAWFHVDEMWPSILRVALNSDILLIGSGFSSTPIIKRLFLENVNINCLDVGSMGDIFCTNRFRNLHKYSGEHESVAELWKIYEEAF